MLSKFHTRPELIQGLWLVAIPVTVLGVTRLVLRSVTQVFSISSRRSWRGRLIYGVYQDEQGRWMVYGHGHQRQEIDRTNLPLEPIGRGQVSQDLLRRPEE